MAIPRHLPRFPHLRLLAAGLAMAAGCLPAAAAEPQTRPEEPPRLTLPAASPPAVHAAATETAWWRGGIAVFASLWDDARTRLADDTPDWLQHLSRRKPSSHPADAGNAYVVLQDDRADGMDLVTVRYRLAEQGALHAYAGAGLNHARYFVDDPAAGPSLLNRRNRHSDVGATAELGAEIAVSERVRLQADLRWADLDERADLLHTAHGPVAAEAVTLGISLGYRFR
jgi:hypothetical protein